MLVSTLDHTSGREGTALMTTSREFVNIAVLTALVVLIAFLPRMF